MSSLFEELSRRNVFRVGIAYLAAVWLIFQVVETVLPLFGFQDSFLKMLFIVLVIGILPTLACAWIYEITPEGIKLEKDVDRKKSITSSTGKKLDRIIMIVLSVAVAYFAIDKFLIDPRRDARLVDEAAEVAAEQAIATMKAALPERSIAVLPFKDLSPDGNQAYLAEGFAEELLNLLAGIPELRVIAKSSAFSFAGQDVAPSSIASQLNVAHLLAGSVREANQQLRISIQLIDARTNTQLWSRSFDRVMENIFAMQDEIAAEVVDQLKVSILGDLPTASVTDPDAFALFLHARYLDNRSSAENAVRSAELYRQSLAIDPEYAAAWSGLMRNSLNQAYYNLITSDEAIARAREAAAMSIAADAHYAPTRARLGFLEFVYANDLRAAAEQVNIALVLDPYDPVVIAISSLLAVSLGRTDDSIVIAEFVTERDPVNAYNFDALGDRYYRAGRTAEAIAAFKRCMELSPGFAGVHYRTGLTWLVSGDPVRALDAIEAETATTWRLLGRALVLWDLGRKSDADEALNELIEIEGVDWAVPVASVYSWRGDPDKAFEWLQQAADEGDGVLLLQETVVEPLFKKIHADPRWLPFLQSIGKAPNQLASIELNLPDHLRSR